ncbi:MULTISPECIES: hypothetical protein [unclassified Roseitalea]|uniref:alpha/beta hydrolase family protein n=1 Tax=unclassified Roseitalea TaxID=2639107 RepID=UPI00273D36EF|nr:MULTISPECIES: hypothetical protein [unclassified Roseitalea]
MFTAGYSTGFCLDPDRPAWRTNDPRPLVWSAWYPADAQDTVELSDGVDDAWFKSGPIAPNARLSEKRAQWPTVLLSHGTGGSADGMGWLGRRLAERGFIAWGVSHHGNTSIEPYLPEGFACWWERARDLSVLLDLLTADGPFAGRIDTDSVFASGFSLGGYAVLCLAGALTDLDLFEAWRQTEAPEMGGPREFPDLADRLKRLEQSSETFRRSVARHGQSWRDHRIRAVVAYAPAPTVRAFEPQSVASIDIPVALMTGAADAEAPFEACTRWLEKQNPSFAVSRLDEPVGHYVFLQEATDVGKAAEPSICVDPQGIDRRAIHERAAAAAIDLFARVGA